MMSVKSETIGGTHVISVHGELDRGGADTLMRAIDDEVADRVPRLALDLTGMTFMDSTGLGALLFAWARTQERGGQLVLVLPLDAHARRTIEVRGVAERLRVVATLDEALTG